ncbi:MAG: hypothetical protein ACLGG0_06850 [Bacteriovoracia bacterium]
MRFLVLIMLSSSFAMAAEFPDREYRQAETKLGLLKIGESLSQIAGREGQFDSAAALQKCDSVDKALNDGFKARRQARLKSIRESEVNVMGWEARAKDALMLDSSDKVTLTEALKKEAKKWRSEAKQSLPCTDAVSIDFVENLADDFNAADEPVFNLCVRTVKALRKSPECGRSIQEAQTGAVKLSIPTP